MEYNNLIFRNQDIIGKGDFSYVYRVFDGKYYYTNLVVKKFNKSLQNKIYMIKSFIKHNNPYMKEIDTTYELSMDNIAPRIIYYNNSYFVMEKMDYTLYDIIKKNIISINHIEKLIELIKRLNKTQYRHTDLHFNNVMWSNQINDFRIIDWGFYIKLKNNKEKNKKYNQNGIMLKEMKYYIENKYIKNKKWYNIYNLYMSIIS